MRYVFTVLIVTILSAGCVKDVDASDRTGDTVVELAHENYVDDASKDKAFAFTVNVRSESMNKDVPVTIVKPDCYRSGEDFPVVYILHGHSGNNNSWNREGHMERLADKYDVLVVMPDGGWNSWYFDSPITPEYKYETFVSKELVDYVDENFKTLPEPSARAITGNSMGGHGAFYNAIRHQDVFGNVGSTSGGVDFRPWPSNWEIAKRLGSKEEYPENWEKNTVINMTDQIKPGLNIIFDCGTEDFFYQVNCNLHKKLDEAGILHVFNTGPGGHSWSYWFDNIEKHFIFFNNNFRK